MQCIVSVQLGRKGAITQLHHSSQLASTQLLPRIAPNDSTWCQIGRGAATGRGLIKQIKVSARKGEKENEGR